METKEQTIAALITARGVAPVSVIRVSGERVKEVISKTCESAGSVIKTPRKAVLTDVRLLDGTLLDSALVVYFCAPGSFTGEDVAEFNFHGSTFIVQSFIEELAQLDVRVARPGEFSERAFYNGCLDLTQAEAITDIIAAQTKTQLGSAQAQNKGVLRNAVSELGTPLRGSLAEIEAYIDFPEEDISGLTVENWKDSLEEVRNTISSYIESFRVGKLIREGISAVLVGEVNVGKSSLLNALSCEERVIVTDIPGTTRDLVDTSISVGGHLIRLWDTAGLREDTTDKVEQIGIERTRSKLEEADISILVVDGTSPVFDVCAGNFKPDIICINKWDQLEHESVESLVATLEKAFNNTPICVISAKTQKGLDSLREVLLSKVSNLFTVPGSESVVITNSRHKDSLIKALDAINRSLNLLKQSADRELVSIELRDGLKSLEEIIGLTHNEDLLGLIFSKFCIGK